MTTEHKPHSGVDDVAERSSTESPMASGGNRSAPGPHSVRPTGREVALEKQVIDLEYQVHGLSSLVADKLMEIDRLVEQLEALRERLEQTGRWATDVLDSLNVDDDDPDFAVEVARLKAIQVNASFPAKRPDA